VLNRYPRYVPLVRFLQQRSAASILEIGTSGVGLAGFWSAPIVACDPAFPQPVHPNLVPVAASGECLPFLPGSFDLVVCQDTLEHLPPNKREGLLREAARVSRRYVYISFPRGRGAVFVDRLYALFHSRLLRLPVPDWLHDHLHFPPVRPESVRRTLAMRGAVTACRSENLLIHLMLLVLEHWTRANRALLQATQTHPRLTGFAFRLAHLPPSYRQVYILDINPPIAPA